MTRPDPRAAGRPDLRVRRSIAPHAAIAPVRRSGDEHLTLGGQPLDDGRLIEVWRWSMSGLLDNTVRGLFAEYLVARALGTTDSGVRVEWDAVDVVTAEGLRVEVKSVSFLQSWAQSEVAPPSVSIPETFGWDGRAGRYDTRRRRQADVYVVCVLDVTDVENLDALNWTCGGSSSSPHVSSTQNSRLRRRSFYTSSPRSMASSSAPTPTGVPR